MIVAPMRIHAFTVAAALGLAACGGQVGPDDVDEQGESFSSYNQRLIGAYQNSDGKGHYPLIAIKDDATYLALTDAGQERGSYTLYKPWFGAGQLTLTPTDPPGPAALYYTSLAWFGGGLKMTHNNVTAQYQSLSSGYCAIDTDCNGQPFDKQKLSCGASQHEANLCTMMSTCTNACVDNGPGPSGPPG
jgi:hypothetical protein